MFSRVSAFTFFVGIFTTVQSVVIRMMFVGSNNFVSHLFFFIFIFHVSLETKQCMGSH